MKLPCSASTKDFNKMALETSFSPHKKVIGTFLSLLLILLFSIPLQAQVNASKGVPSYTNYVIGDVNLAGQQVWNVNQNKEGFLFVGTSSGLQKFDGKNWELLASPTNEFNTNVRATLLASDSTFYFGSLG
jgi:ligand-binding sensor domain-containing protein